MTEESFRCYWCDGAIPASGWYWQKAGPQAGKRIVPCRECQPKKRKAYRDRDPERALKVRKWKYGISPEETRALLASQGESCAICGSTDPGGKWGTFVVDHDHSCCQAGGSCGRCVRGLLCGTCNVGLGMFKDDPSLILNAFNYLIGRSGGLQGRLSDQVA